MTSLWFLIASTAALAVLSLWFFLEERSNIRIGRIVRVEFDRGVDMCQRNLDQAGKYFGSGWILTQLHWLLYTALDFCMRLLRFLERGVVHLQRRNIRHAERIYKERQQTDSALSQLAVHKASTSLTDTEKAARRQAHLEGKQ